MSKNLGFLNLLVLCSVASCLASNVARAATLVVTNTGDSGTGSLRQALLDANKTTSGSFIQFNIPESDTGFSVANGTFTIRPAAALPVITVSGVTIDGSTQTAFTGNTNSAGPEVVISGSSQLGDGLVVQGANCRISSLVVNGFGGSGISLTGPKATANRVEGCYAGTDARGAVAVPNYNGVLVSSGAHNNFIGGMTVGARNVLSGNRLDGAHVVDRGTDANTVEGNFIGTDRTGTKALPNQASGIAIVGGKTNLVGGGLPGVRNIISGNKSFDIYINDVGTIGNRVQGNYIGTDVTGAHALMPDNVGIAIGGGAAGNVVGGFSAGLLNVISGHSQNGVLIWFSATGNLVQGNYIGLNATGTAALPNKMGVWVSNGASHNVIGGTSAGARNIISGNSLDGIHITDAATTLNQVQGNYIGTNAAGTTALANQAAGVAIVGGAHNNLIGGTVTGARNVIAGNGLTTNFAGNGVYIGDTGSISNLVQGNYIGLNATGTAAIANTENGVTIAFGAKNNLIGGSVPETRNLISGNRKSGIYIVSQNSSGNRVQGNYIGLNPTGLIAIPNDGGIYISMAANSLIGGTAVGVRNLISGNQIQGITIDGSTAAGNVVQGNYIGTNAVGTAAVANKSSGVIIQNGAHSNIIGGTIPGARNIISGNLIDGIHISDSGTANNTVQGNYIGTNATGIATLANQASGVAVVAGAQGNVVGGEASGACNVISGNSYGVYIGGSNSNQVQGNYIGTNVNGMAIVANKLSGIGLFGGAQNNRIGGTNSAARNIVSGNRNGIEISGSGTMANTVLGNFVGTNVLGTGVLRNQQSGIACVANAQSNIIGDAAIGAGNVVCGNQYGVYLGGSNKNTVQGNYIGTNTTGSAVLPNTDTGLMLTFTAQNNLIGGTTVADGNVIAYNKVNGIFIGLGGGNNNQIKNNRITRNSQSGVDVRQGIGNVIRQNTMSSNGGLGINLQPDGEADNTVTPNDPGDGDTGPNNLQNFPVISSASTTNGTTTIEGTLNSTPYSSFDVDFYGNNTLDPAGNGEGENYLGSIRISTGSDGSGAFLFSPTTSGVGPYITATATNSSTGDTSEFSKAITVSTVAPGAWRARVPGLSTITLNVAQSSVELLVTGPLDQAAAADAASYQISINGQIVAVQSAAYDAVRHRVMLAVAEGSLHSGDSVRVTAKEQNLYAK